MLNEGIVISIFSTMIFTSLIKFIKEKILKNTKIKYYIPNGFILALFFGIFIIIILHKYNLLTNIKDPLWDFLESYLIIIGLSGYGKIAGEKILIFIKALISDKQTQIAQAELEIEKLKKKINKRKEKIKYLKNIKNK